MISGGHLGYLKLLDCGRMPSCLKNCVCGTDTKTYPIRTCEIVSLLLTRKHIPLERVKLCLCYWHESIFHSNVWNYVCVTDTKEYSTRTCETVSVLLTRKNIPLKPVKLSVLLTRKHIPLERVKLCLCYWHERIFHSNVWNCVCATETESMSHSILLFVPFFYISNIKLIIQLSRELHNYVRSNNNKKRKQTYPLERVSHWPEAISFECANVRTFGTVYVDFVAACSVLDSMLVKRETIPPESQRERGVVMLLIYTGREFHTSDVLRYRVHLQHSEDSHTFQCMLGYFGVSVIHRTVTRTTGSLTCVCDLFTCLMHTRGISVERLIRRTFIFSIRKNFNPGEISGRSQN